MNNNEWAEMTADEKANFLKINLENAVNQINSRLNLYITEIGNLATEVRELSAKIEDIQGKK